MDRDKLMEEISRYNYRGMLASKIGTIIKSARKDANLTQAELAKKLGVNRVTLARYESGDILPKTEKLIKLGELFPDYNSIIMSEIASENEHLTEKNALHERTEGYLYDTPDLLSKMLIEEMGYIKPKWLPPYGWLIQESEKKEQIVVSDDDMDDIKNVFIQHLKIDFPLFLKSKGKICTKEMLIEFDNMEKDDGKKD